MQSISLSRRPIKFSAFPILHTAAAHCETPCRIVDTRGGSNAVTIKENLLRENIARSLLFAEFDVFACAKGLQWAA